MDKVDRKKFLKVSGISRTSIPPYKKRGKIYIEEDGTFDLDHPINRDFIASRSGKVKPEKPKPVDTPKKSKKKLKPKPVKKAKPPKKKPAPKSTKQVKVPVAHTVETKPEVRTEDEVRYAESLRRYEQEQRKNALDIELKELAKEEKRIKNDKLRGETIPTALVKSLIQTQANAARSAFSEAIDNYLILIQHKAKLTGKESSDIRKQLNQLVNSAIDKSVLISKKGVGAIVDKYSKSRGVGESK